MPVPAPLQDLNIINYIRNSDPYFKASHKKSVHCHILSPNTDACGIFIILITDYVISTVKELCHAIYACRLINDEFRCLKCTFRKKYTILSFMLDSDSLGTV